MANHTPILVKTLGDFQPESCGLDFELAHANAFIQMFGEDVFIWYCLFHLYENCREKVFESNRARYLNPNEAEFATRCRMLPALAFLPDGDIIIGFEELLEYDENHPETPNLIPEELIEYFEKNYIGKPGKRRNTRRIPR